MKLYVFRHGQTNGNVNNIVQGAGVDIPLNDTGRAQALELAKKMENENLNAIYASQMKRAQETARIVSQDKIPVKIIPGLEEVHFGEAEGMYSEEAHQKYADVFSVIHDSSNPDWMKVCVPGGESVRDSLERGKDALDRVIAESRAQGWEKIGIATHGALMFNIYQDMFGKEYKFANCEYFVIEC